MKLKQITQELDSLNKKMFHMRTKEDKDRMHTLYNKLDEERRPILTAIKEHPNSSEFRAFVHKCISEYYLETGRPVDSFIVKSKYEAVYKLEAHQQKITHMLLEMQKDGEVIRLKRTSKVRRGRVQWCGPDHPQAIIDDFLDNQKQYMLENRQYLGEDTTKKPYGNIGKSKRT